MATRLWQRVPLLLLLVACGTSEKSGAAEGGAPSGEGGGSGARGGATQSAGGSSGGTTTPNANGGQAPGGANSSGEGGGAMTSGGSLAMSSGGSLGKGGANSGAGGSTVQMGGSAGRTSVGGAGSGGATGAAGALGMPTEKALTSLPMTRQEHSVVAAAGEVYVIGGYAKSSTNVTDSVQAYNPEKNSWRDVKNFPARMNHGNAGVIADKIYVAGFYINGTMSTATTQVYSYDPSTDAWTEKAPLPTGTERAASCVAVDAGLMYVVGGAHDGMSVDSAARYDPVADKWETLPPLPERREHCTAGAIGGIIYVAGGRRDGITGIEPSTWAYDPAAKSWTQKASLPTPRGGLAGAVLRGHLFVFGGEGNMAANSNGVFPNIDAYDPVTNTWEAMPPMQVPRHGYGAAALGDRIYLPGGATKQGAAGSDQVSVFWFP